MGQLTVSVYAHTDVGRSRTHNEDNVCAFVREGSTVPLALLAVADGMGGHQSGEVASQIMIDQLTERLGWMMARDEKKDTAVLHPDRPALHLHKRLELAIQSGNEAIVLQQEEQVAFDGMGTTITAALIYGSQAVVANVGDSRTYLWRDTHLKQITDDHSFVGELVRTGQLAPEEVYDHPRKNVVLRAAGTKELKVDLFTVTLEKGDLLILCSDGLWEMIRNLPEIIAGIQSDSLVEMAQKLIDLANENGGQDNSGVALARVH